MLTLFKAYGFIIEKDNKYHLSDISDNYLTGGSSFDLSSYVSSLKESPVCIEMKKVLLLRGNPRIGRQLKIQSNGPILWNPI